MTNSENGSSNLILSPLDNASRAKLREFLTTRFSLSELEALASDLNLSRDAVRHQTIAEFAIDTLNYFEKEKNWLPFCKQ
jgi:hypothetical protein